MAQICLRQTVTKFPFVQKGIAITVKMDLCDLGTPELAYLGDSVIELLVRHRLIQNGVRGAGELNSAAKKYVTAAAQSDGAQKLLPHLTEAEAAVLRRARNHKTNNVPKSASAAQYHLATGLEALFAYLYLNNETDRLHTLFDIAFDDVSQNNT